MARPTTLGAAIDAARTPMFDSWSALPPERAARHVGVLFTISLLYPVIVCVLFYPTPYVDLREQINWGLTYPIVTWKHPPLQSWVAALAALAGPRDAWFYMAVAQVLNVICLYYLIRIAREFLDQTLIAPFLLLGACNVYLSAWMPTTALNADHIQAPLWAAIIYHAMAAARDDRWRDWLVLAVTTGMAMLAKYFGIVLVASLLIATATTREYRRVFVNGKFYASACVAAAIALPFVAIEFSRRYMIYYSGNFFDPGESIATRLDALVTFVSPFALLWLPLIIVAVAGWKENGLKLARWPRTESARFLGAAAVAFVAIMLGMIFLAGLKFHSRFSYPYLPVAALLVLGLVRVEPAGLIGLVRTMWIIWLALIAGTVGYGTLVLRDQLQDPAPQAAAIMRGEWSAAYSCAPGYIMGEGADAHAVALYYSKGPRPVIGLSDQDYAYAPWTDRERIRRFGAIIVASTEEEARQLFAQDFPDRTPPRHIELPYRRGWSGKLHHYYYVFIPPRAC
jgi:hypothetical protein